MNTTDTDQTACTCTVVTATDDQTGTTAAGIRLCDRHRQQGRANLAAARRDNPEVDAVHRMIEAAGRDV